MPTYLYKAVDAKGKVIRGSMEASHEVDVTTQLARIGYLPVAIGLKEEKVFLFSKLFKLKKIKIIRKVNPESIVIFTRQFATIVKAAVPIIEGLEVLAEQAEDPVLKSALNKIIKDVEAGSSLSLALSKHPAVFSDLYVNTVVAGESGGVLAKVLLRLSEMLEKDQDTRTNISSALRYPVMVLAALFIAVFVLSVFVIPQFAKIYKDSHVALPLPTLILIAVGKFFKDYWFISLPSVFGSVFILKRFINTKPGRFFWDGLKFQLGPITKVYVKIVMLRFASMLSVLYQSGLPVLKIMDIVGKTIGNVLLVREIDKIKIEVSEGKGISGGVLTSSYFPRLVGYMVSIGEKSGSLPLMLDSLCEYYELETKTAIKNLTTLIEPLMTLILGTVVMGMALAIFLPLWGMLQAFKAAG